MTGKRLCTHMALFALGLANTLHAQIQVDYQLSKIDEGVAWVSSYWGYNTPKLVYDGDTFYTVGLWGEQQSTSTGVIYKLEDGSWRRGYSWDDLDYQPGTILLDSEGRLVLIYPRISAGPVVLRSVAPGDIDHFESIPVPAAIGKAGYLGAGIFDDRIVLGYIGDPNTYSFVVAVLDLATQQWSGPQVLAEAQRQEEPWTTWLYPIIQPDADGFHLVVSNNADLSSYYDRMLYMYVPFDDMANPRVEQIARVDPWTENLAFAEAMWRSPDGAVYVTGQYKPEDETNQLFVYRRDPRTEEWTDHLVSGSQVAAVFESAHDTGRLWMPSTYGSQLRLYSSTDAASTWQLASLPDFADADLISTFFLYGITPASGSVMPDVPTAVFSAGPHPNYQLWFVQFDTEGVPTAVVEEDAAARPERMDLRQNFPNPFNAETTVHFELVELVEPAVIDLTVYGITGQKVATLARGWRAGGAHTLKWNGRDEAGRPMASGVYLYRLRAGVGVELTRRMLLLR